MKIIKSNTSQVSEVSTSLLVLVPVMCSPKITCYICCMSGTIVCFNLDCLLKFEFLFVMLWSLNIQP